MIFLDTTVLVGAIDRTDVRHPDGAAVIRAVENEALGSAVTTDFVLDETLTVLRRRKVRASVAAGQVRTLASSPRVQVAFIDEELFMEAMEVYEAHKALSFTDASTVATMRRGGIRTLFSHDRDFDDVQGIERHERP